MGDIFITKINPHDVLLGRGPPSFNFEGNIRFAGIVNPQRDAYRATDSTQLKNQIARSIMNTIHNNGGRFVRQLQTTAEIKQALDTKQISGDINDEEFKVWKIVDEQTALNKIKHTLRGSQRASTLSSIENPATRKVSSSVPTIHGSFGGNISGEKHPRTTEHAIMLIQQTNVMKQQNDSLQAQIAERDKRILSLQGLLAKLQQQQQGGTRQHSTLVNNNKINIDIGQQHYAQGHMPPSSLQSDQQSLSQISRLELLMLLNGVQSKTQQQEDHHQQQKQTTANRNAACYNSSLSLEDTNSGTTTARNISAILRQAIAAAATTNATTITPSINDWLLSNYNIITGLTKYENSNQAVKRVRFTKEK